ncbi:MAG: ATP-binding protein [Candidatus Bathyarchaeia archaeon]|jgi:signal transduction histidine kinase/transcriptional regulator with PAS, ATPase and Fis domain
MSQVDNLKIAELQKEVERLKGLLEEKEASLLEVQETLDAIRSGAVDGLVRSTAEGDQLFILKGSDQPYRNLVEEMNEGALLISNNGTILYCNSGFAKLLKTRLDKLMGYNLKDWLSASGLEIFNRLPLKDASLNRVVYEITFLTAEAQLVPTLTSFNTIPMDSVNAIALIVTDLTKHMEKNVKHYTESLEKEITERKKAETKIQSLLTTVEQERDRYNLLLNSIPDEVWFADVNGKFTLANPLALKQFDVDSLDSVRKIAGILEVYDSNGSKRPIDKAPPLRALKGEIVQDEEIVRMPTSGELRYRQVNAVPVRDRNGNIIGSISVVRDITELKKAEEALRKSEERQAFLLKLSDAIRPLSETGQIQETIAHIVREYFLVDRCYYTTIEDEKANIQWESSREGLPSVIGVYDIDTMPIFKAVIDAGHPLVVKNAKTTDVLDEKLRQLCIKLQVISFVDVPIIKNGKAVGIFNIVHGKPRDWTETEAQIISEVAERTWAAIERARVEEALKEAQSKLQVYASDLEKLVEERTKQLKEKERLAAIGQVAGMVGHDIRNPLQSIVSELYIAKESMKEAPKEHTKEVVESIDFIQEQVDYISKIVADLQDYAKQLKPEFAEVELCQFIQEAAKSINIPDNVETALICEKQVPTVKLDRTFTKRILTNLVTNAIQAMPKGGKITIKASKEKGYAVISVEDTGVGIPEEVKEKMFTPMFTTKSKGQGFGLAVVKRLAEAQKGSISFKSETGKGTTFYLKLPLK